MAVQVPGDRPPQPSRTDDVRPLSPSDAAPVPDGVARVAGTNAATAGPQAEALAAAAVGEPVEAHHSSLFGRDLLYVAVMGLPLLSAAVVSPVLAYLLPPDQFGQLSSAIALHQV